MRRTRGLLLLVIGIFVFFTAKNEALASDLQREYYKVISGTATKLGTEEQEQVIKGTYLEEWMVPDDCVLEEDVAKVLLNSSNANQLPLQIQELSTDVLKDLAGKAVGKEVGNKADVYQGYARLRLSEATAGYTYGILITEDKIAGNYIITGYYSELNQKAIYKIELICEKSSYSQIFKTVKIVSKDTSSEATDSKPENPKPDPDDPDPDDPDPDDPDPDDPVPPPHPNPPEPDDPTPPGPVIPGPTEG